ncbi:MAG: oligosaccharide flippase family protein [Patescibacteria group bacterium]
MKFWLYTLLRRAERYTKTDMVYLAKGGFWINLNYVFGSLISLLLSILFAYYLSKDLFGTYKYIISLAGIAVAFSLNGMNTAVTRAVAQGFEGAFKRSLLVQFRWIVPQVLVTLGLSAYYFFQENYVYGICFLAITLLSPIGTIANTYGAFLQGKKAFMDSALYGGISNLVYFLFVGGAVVFYPNLIVLITAYYGAHALTNSFFCWKTLKKYQPKEEFREEDITYGKHGSFLNTFGILAAHIDSIVVYHLLGPTSLAIYSFALLIPERLKFMFGFVSTVALPKFSEKYAAGEEPDILRKTLQLLAIAAVLIVLYIIAAPFLFSWFFPQYSDSILYSQICSISLLVIAANIPTSAIFAQGSKRGLYVYGILGPLFRVTVVVVSIYFFGLWGAVISRILSYFFQTCLSLILVRKTQSE